MMVDESPEGQAKLKAEYELAASLTDESEDIDLMATVQWRGGYLHLVSINSLCFLGYLRVLIGKGALERTASNRGAADTFAERHVLRVVDRGRRGRARRHI